MFWKLCFFCSRFNDNCEILFFLFYTEEFLCRYNLFSLFTSETLVAKSMSLILKSHSCVLLKCQNGFVSNLLKWLICCVTHANHIHKLSNYYLLSNHKNTWILTPIKYLKILTAFFLYMGCSKPMSVISPPQMKTATSQKYGVLS